MTMVNGRFLPSDGWRVAIEVQVCAELVHVIMATYPSIQKSRKRSLGKKICHEQVILDLCTI